MDGSSSCEEKFKKIFTQNQDSFIGDLKEFLKIRSVSTDPSFDAECQKCAVWVLGHLQKIGLSGEIVKTDGKPVVFAQKEVDEKLPTVLFYGHYDVQPVDPIALWTTDPFAPEIRDGRVYARGAQDNKGQVMYFLKALQEVIAAGTLGCNIKVILEGEEECGSGAITKKLPELTERLKADVLLVCDTGTPDPSRGCITMGLRGILHLEFRLHGPSKDLHSGVHGGLVKNPAIEAARMVAMLHDVHGRVLVPGFYDGLTELSNDDKALANSFAFTEEWYKSQTGVLPTGGEKGIAPMERRGLRPTLEVNGLYSGYLGEGSKTIIPSSATVKLSSRIVDGQAAESTLQKIISYLEKLSPPEFRFELVHSNASGEALLVSASSPIVKAAAETLREVTQSDPLFLWEGASIPLIPALLRASGATPLLVGFGLEDDNIHAPNESFALEQFEKGFLFCCGFLSKE